VLFCFEIFAIRNRNYHTLKSNGGVCKTGFTSLHIHLLCDLCRSLFLFANNTAELRIVRWHREMTISGVAAVHSRRETVGCRARIMRDGPIDTFGPTMAEAVEGHLPLFPVSQLSNKRLLEAICFQPSSSAISLRHALSI
jgi:hypothetical protein